MCMNIGDGANLIGKKELRGEVVRFAAWLARRRTIP